ncbi:hypothetical protein, partial [Aeromonas veronii]|uniref:hypothetical protein n=1 Tax=Aeromonas veronii TaxID=654 RepID=UPI003A4895EB
FTTASVGIHDLAMSARRSLTRGIGELLRLLDPGLSDLVRTPHPSVNGIFMTPDIGLLLW